MAGEETVLRLNDAHVAWREVDGELLLLELRSSTYLSANDSAAVLWRALAQGATRDELAAALVRAYEVPEEQAASDVDAFLETCRERDLVVDETR